MVCYHICVLAVAWSRFSGNDLWRSGSAIYIYMRCGCFCFLTDVLFVSVLGR